MASETLQFLNDEFRQANTSDFSGSEGGDGWEFVLIENRRWMAAAILARVHDHQAVDDVLQETALAATRAQLSGMDKVQLGRWLYRVAVRQSLLFLRRKGRRDRHLDRLAGGLSVEDRVAAGDQAVAGEQGVLLHKALAHMNPRESQLLFWKYCEGWSCAEMADRVGVSAQAVKSRLLRARQRLKEQLLKMQDEWELP